jgi:hypothetical protein
MDCNGAWAAEKRTKELDRPGESRVFVAYPKLNVWLTSYFRCRYGAISQGFAPLLRTFYCEFRPVRNGREDNWNAALDAGLRV